MKIEAGGTYECGCGAIVKYGQGHEHLFHEAIRRLDICAANMPTKEDDGRWWLLADGIIVRFCPAHLDGEGATPDYWRGDRWLTAQECSERGLEVTHPTQAMQERVTVLVAPPARKPVEFKVGDKVRYWSKDRNAWRETTVASVRGDCLWGYWQNPGGGGRSAYQSFVWADRCEHIEPAREGDAPPIILKPSETIEYVPPPARSEQEKLDYFRSVLWPQVPKPFALGQLPAPTTKPEPCACCGGGGWVRLTALQRSAMLASGIDPSQGTRAKCPECK